MSLRLHAGIDLTQIKHTWQGDWNPGQIYYMNDVVKYHGQAFVCVTTVLGDEKRFGKIYQPTVANEYWQPFSNGYLIKGTWSYKEYYYPGDVVRYNDDWYLCNTYTFGGHPIYENGALTTKWTLLASSPRANKQNNHLWLGGYNPMGWTYNMHETPDQFWTQDVEGFTTINGNYEATYIGRGTSSYNFGNGESIPPSHSQQVNGGYDFWDYYDGVRTSITGGMPKCIQTVGGWYHKLFLFDNGEVYSHGYGVNGQNGDGTSGSYYYNRRVGRGTGGRGTGSLRNVFIVKVASSGGLGNVAMGNYEHCAAIDSNGNLYMWGYNGYGQLGNGNTSNLTLPTQIDRKFFDNARIVDVWCTGFASYQNTYALDQNGQLWAWGYTGYGCLGIGEYYTGNATTNVTARPQKVQADFTKYGGIKKFIPGSGSAPKLQVILTNDNHLWAWGYSSYAAGWGYGANDDVIVKPRRLADLIQENTNSLGIDQRKSVGQLSDVVANCEEFWNDDGSDTDTENLIIKERQTGLIFGLGRRYDRSMPYLRGTMYQYSNANNPLYDDDNTNPVMASIGNFKDVKYVIRHGSGTDARSYLWINRDGRVIVTGNHANNVSSGIGLNFTTQPGAREATLPWEFDLSNGKAGTGTQVRWTDRIDMAVGYWDYGWAALTKNNRLVFCGIGDAAYDITPYGQSVAGSTASDINTPSRLANC